MLHVPFRYPDGAYAARIGRIDKRMVVNGADWSIAADGSLAFNQPGSDRTLFTVPAPVMLNERSTHNRTRAVVSGAGS